MFDPEWDEIDYDTNWIHCPICGFEHEHGYGACPECGYEFTYGDDKIDENEEL